MSWMSKDLALDLLAIVIGAAQSAYNRVKDEPEWPVVDERAAGATPESDTQAPPAPQQQQPEEAPAPGPDPEALLTEAKTLLQTMSSTGGTAWIKGTLLPKFGVDKLSDVPAEKLPELIKIAKQKQQEAA